VQESSVGARSGGHVHCSSRPSHTSVPSERLPGWSADGRAVRHANRSIIATVVPVSEGCPLVPRVIKRNTLSREFTHGVVEIIGTYRASSGPMVNLRSLKNPFAPGGQKASVRSKTIIGVWPR